MNKLLAILAFIFISHSSLSQSLEGYWKGQYETNKTGLGELNMPISDKTKTIIDLKFILNPDSTYQIFSYTREKNANNEDTTVICKMIYEIIDDSIYLEEIEQLKSEFGGMYFQRMGLQINKGKKFTTLTGKWESVNNLINSSGKIYFRKRNKD